MRVSKELKTCMKYDLWSLFRFWWPFAIATLVAAIPLGLLSRITFSDDYIDSTESSIIHLISSMSVMVAYTILIGFTIYTVGIICVRYYKNFYTDEGYLTFTLPVNRETLFRSKLLSSIIFYMAYSVVLVISLFMYFSMISSETAVTTITDMLEFFFTNISFFSVTLVIEILLLIAITSVISILMIFTCITLGSTMFKKHKILGTILLFYLINNIVLPVVTFIGIFYFALLVSLGVEAFTFFGEIREKALFLVGGLGVNLVLTAFTGFLYCFTVGNIERRLNLE